MAKDSGHQIKQPGIEATRNILLARDEGVEWGDDALYLCLRRSCDTCP